MKAKNIVRLSWFVLLLLLTSLVTLPVYSQTYDEWFAQGWDAGCEDSTSGSMNQTEGKNTPFIKGYNLGFAECSPSSAANNTAVTNMTQETDGDKTQAASVESAYDIGCGDVGLTGNERYINQPGNEPSSQTDEFMQDYYRGYYECGGTFPAEEGQSEPSDTPQPVYTPQQRIKPFEPSNIPQFPQPPPMQSGFDWSKICNDLQVALVSSCEVLVNPDNTLTSEGDRAVGCIRNGIALAGGGALLLSLPLPLIISSLQALEQPTGCGGIVEWGAIGSIPDLEGIINLLT